ncbi:MAG: DUF885 domain-containing protein [Dehalococcoidia bacterium]
MSRVYEIADRFVDRLAELDPVSATFIGIAGHDSEMSDYSPDSAARMAEAERETIDLIRAESPDNERERLCRDTVTDELGLSLEQYEAGEHLRSVNVIHSPVQSLRMVFDMMPRATAEDWRNIASRMDKTPQAVSGYRLSLSEGVRRGLTSSRRQAGGAARQAMVWSGSGEAPSFFATLLDAYDRAGIGDDALRSDLERGVTAASEAYADLAWYLQDEYMPAADEKDGVGNDRYALHSRSYNGVDLDLAETYAWGWEQVRWVQSEMAKTAERIKPGASVGEAVNILENDPARSIEGEDQFRQWMQDLQVQTIREMDGTHFDLAEPVRRIEAMIAPPGGQLAMYYTGPSEDFSRPGRTWYPTGGKTRFPLWREVSIAYHEGVPGHHFQIATTKSLAGELSRYQRLIAGTSGYVEGWALYAERLMGELGYLDNPDYYMGMLDAQALRSVRVVVDIGMHLGLEIPPDSDFHPGEVWTPEMALEFMKDRVHFPADFVASEIDRYLGIPGQAISYKVGEREWLQARDSARGRAGADFNLKDWHNRALRLGPMGLAQMRREMTKV